MKKVLIALSLFCALGPINAQVKVNVSAKKKVGLNGCFYLTFSVNATASRIILPNLSEFKVLNGPTNTISTSYTLINGKERVIASNEYSYTIQAKKIGTYTIGKASIIVNDIIYYSDPVSIEVVDYIKPKTDSTFVRPNLNKIFNNTPVTNNVPVSFKAIANNLVGLNRSFSLSFIVNGESLRLIPPDLSEFKILSGPNNSTSTCISMMNGKTTNAVSTNYCYDLQAKKLGTFTIGKASIIVRDSVYYSDPISIMVVNYVKPTGDTAFVRLNLNKKTIYQGEQVTATFKVHYKTQINFIENFNLPKFKNFWIDRFENSSNLQVVNENVNGMNQTENVNGIVYKTVTLQKLVLSPLRSGNFSIGSCKLEFKLQNSVKGRDFFDQFGQNNGEFRELSSSPTSIKVLPLPGNKPASFIGGVGKNFTIQASVNKDNVNCFENIILKLLISGDGNLKLLGNPKIKLDPSMEIMEPKVEFSINNDTTFIDTIIYEYTITPHKNGNYTIPSLPFSYFDIVSKQYRTISGKEIEIKVVQCNNEHVDTKINPDHKMDIAKVANIVIALDLSSSMLAMDIEPNRLMASKEVAINFIKHNEDGRIGLVLFGKNSFSLSPLTNDYAKLISLANKIDTGMVIDGTAIGIGLATAINQIKDSTIRHKYIILLTDGINNYGEIDPITAAQIARMFNIRLYTIGVGKSDSAMYPIKTPMGLQNIKILTKLDEATLIEMSHITNGKYFRVISKEDLTRIFNEIHDLEKNKAENSKNIAAKNNQAVPGISYEMAHRVLHAIEIEENIMLEKFKKEKVLTQSEH